MLCPYYEDEVQQSPKLGKHTVLQRPHLLPHHSSHLFLQGGRAEFMELSAYQVVKYYFFHFPVALYYSLQSIQNNVETLGFGFFLRLGGRVGGFLLWFVCFFFVLFGFGF